MPLVLECTLRKYRSRPRSNCLPLAYLYVVDIGLLLRIPVALLGDVVLLEGLFKRSDSGGQIFWFVCIEELQDIPVKFSNVHGATTFGEPVIGLFQMLVDRIFSSPTV